MAENDKYEFNLDDPDSWSKMPRPFMSEDFIKETLRIGGVNRHGKPRFKWTWGMAEEVFIPGEPGIPEGWYLKYEMCSRKRLIGFSWTDITGKRFCERAEDVPEGVIAEPVHKIDQIGTPRWVLEEWRDEGDCNGMYDRSGYFFSRWILADDKPEHPFTYLKPYRDPNDKDLEILAHYVQLTATLTEKDIRQGVAEDRAREAEAEAKQKAEKKEETTEIIYEGLINSR